MKNRASLLSGDFAFLRNPAARAALTPLSWLYHAGWFIRKKRFDFAPVAELPTPVISVGNITVGGTGKTPVARFLSARLAAKGFHPGVCIRGYGRASREALTFAPGQPGVTWREAGDEALLHLQSGAAVGVCADRTRSARALIDPGGCDAILLDDGFQFRTLHRDLNIAIIDATRPYGFKRLVPAGLLREPIACLAEAELFWITRADLLHPKELDRVRHSLSRRFKGIPKIITSFRPDSLLNLHSGKIHQAAKLRELAAEQRAPVPAISVCAIGNPAAFDLSLRSITGAAPTAFHFRDHHPFTARELADIDDDARRNGVQFIITTEKDAVRFPPDFKPSRRWHALRIVVEFHKDDESILDSMLDNALVKARTK